VTSTLTPEQATALQLFYAAQSHAIDGGDAEGWARSFTIDGSFHSPTYGAPIVGHTALKAFAEHFYASSGARQHRHWINNIAWSELDGDEVEVAAYALIVASDPGQPPTFLRSSMFKDRLTLTRSGWRLRERTAFPDPMSKQVGT